MKVWLAALCLSLLTGCAGVRLIDTQVQTSTAGAPIQLDAGYRFERLPSQSEAPAQTEQVERLTQQALAGIGLVLDIDHPRYGVLLGVRMQSYLADAWGRPLGAASSGIYGNVMIGMGSGTGGMLGWGMRFPPPTLYRHELSLILRDLHSGEMVYETRALHDGPWADTLNLLPALLEAALQDFPNPPNGIRQIKIELQP